MGGEGLATVARQGGRIAVLYPTYQRWGRGNRLYSSRDCQVGDICLHLVHVYMEALLRYIFSFVSGCRRKGLVCSASFAGVGVSSGEDIFVGVFYVHKRTPSSCN